MDAIPFSLFDLFRIGPGPSSSHTIGPMRAALRFVRAAAELPDEVLGRAAGIEIRLFGSLSATGEGHGTMRALLAGLLGHEPHSCPADLLDQLRDAGAALVSIRIRDKSISFSREDIVLDAIEHERPHSNTLRMRLTDADGRDLFEQEYYSVGGGSIHWKDGRPPEIPDLPHPFASMRSLRELLADKRLSLHEAMLENETAVSGRSREQTLAGLAGIMEAMEDAIARGRATGGALPGAIGLMRKAPGLFARARRREDGADDLLVTLAACAFAAGEENAAGRTIVTAPTAGSCGVVPAVIHVLRNIRQVLDEAIRHGLLAAAAVGFLAKHNASVSGAEVGCQGEIGVASAMAAALLAYAKGYGVRVVENAAEIALEHHLGMTCDPVGGYVQIPCIERNAMGAVKAYTAFLVASTVAPAQHMVGLDQAIAAMAETGRDMCARYKETSRAGLARVFSC